MAKVIIVLLIALVFEAVGVVYLSAGLKEIGEVPALKASDLARLTRRAATNPKMLLGVLLETIFFVFLLVLLRRNDVSLIWPLTSLVFVLTALSARFILHEEIPLARWMGVFLIMMGAALVSWSQKAKTSPLPAQAAIGSTAQPGAE